MSAQRCHARPRAFACGRDASQIDGCRSRREDALGAGDRSRIDEAIEKMEQAWALTQIPRSPSSLPRCTTGSIATTMRLSFFARRFARIRRHPLLRHHAAITLLRHGAAPDIRDFFASVLKIDPDDAFAQFVMSLLDSYDVWVDELVSSIVQKGDGRRPFIISCPVWGQPFADNFAHYICAALLSPNNLARVGETLFGPSRDLHDGRDGRPPHCRPVVRSSRALCGGSLCALYREAGRLREVHGSPLWAARGFLFPSFAGVLLRPQLQVRSDVLCPLCGACGGSRD